MAPVKAQPTQPTQLEQPFGPLAARAFPDVDSTDAADVVVSGIAADSRHVKPGYCFVATEGTRTDGHDYIAQAAEAGAVVIVAQRTVPTPPDVPLVIVPDSRAALARLAATFHGLDVAQRPGGLRVVGVTGTNGKTTVAHLLRSILRTQGWPCALIGTVEIDLVGRVVEASMTTPPAVELTRHLVEAAKHGAACAVIETSSHALDQRRCDGVRFDAAIFTNLTGDHLDYHETREHYLAAKKRLFDGLSATGTAIINADDPAGDAIIADCDATVVRFGLAPGADVRAELRDADSAGSRFTLITPRGRVDVALPFVGRHNVLNALAAAAAGMAFGADDEAIRRGLQDAGPVPGRLERVDGPDSAPTVLVDYAHTDDALRNVLGAVRALEPRRLWVVFGCGGDRDATKRPRMGRIAAELADQVVVTSDNPRTEPITRINDQILAGISAADRRHVHVEPDRRIAIEWAVTRADRGDIVLLAGKGHETYQIVGTERLPFDDRQAAAGALARRDPPRRARTG